MTGTLAAGDAVATGNAEDTAGTAGGVGAEGGRAQLWSDLRLISVPFVLAHALSIGGWVLATVIKRRLRGNHFVPGSFAGIFGWGSWDGRYYHNIAARSYQAFEPHGRRFFPLYPLIGKVLRIPLLGRTDLALLIIAKVSLVVAAVLLIRLVRLETRDELIVRNATWFLFLFPGSFVLLWAYSEPTFLALTIGAVYLMRTNRFGWAAVLAFAAGLCRPLGIALVPAAAIEGWRLWRTVGLGERLKRLAAVGASGGGMLAYLTWIGYRYGWHEFWTPLTIQNGARTNKNPIGRLLELSHQMVGKDAMKVGLHVPFMAAFALLLYYVVRRLPLSYTAFVAVIMVLTLSAENLNSLERYGLNAFPLIIGLAMFSRLDERIEWLTLSLGAVTLTSLTALALSGSYVP